MIIAAPAVTSVVEAKTSATSNGIQMSISLLLEVKQHLSKIVTEWGMHVLPWGVNYGLNPDVSADE